MAIINIINKNVKKRKKEKKVRNLLQSIEELIDNNRNILRYFKIIIRLLIAL